MIGINGLSSFHCFSMVWILTSSVKPATHFFLGIGPTNLVTV